MTATSEGAAPATRLLDGIAGPADLRAMSPPELGLLADEIRGFLVDTVSRTGGHLGPNLGVVELTIALHRAVDSPADTLVFDTGHQTYVHKLLTGRREGFATLRRSGGLSGYPSRSESPHDLMENSHASTALSYADGLAKAAALRDHGGRVVAVVGDGALTGGMSWEAVNNIGAAPERPVVVVLNDNGRSYAPTVGGIARHLADLRARRPSGPGAARANVFTDFGLAYIGPVDGHDIAATEEALHAALELARPVVVHCVTRKGNGHPPAELDLDDHMHTVRAGSAAGRPAAPAGPAGSAEPTWTSVFAEEIAAIGAERDDIVCLGAAMTGPAGLGPFARRFPGRVFDVGIAEQHAVGSAAGLALGGLHPVVAIYATFLNRALDQVLMDVALHRLPVTFVLDRAGITGPDGPSHHGVWDASILPVVPGLRLAAPRDRARLRELLREAVAVVDGPTALRYPKAGAALDIPALRRTGRCDLLREETGARVLLVAVGPMAGACLGAADELAAAGVPATVADPRWIAPLDPALLALARAHRLVLAVEDTTSTGALGARLSQALADEGAHTRVAALGLPPRFLPQGARDRLLSGYGLDAEGIAAAVLHRLARLHRG
ncbi:1-deoxy-D-xylulose-5-phosphate synthase [Nocardiopsis mangrovi]|uniref:1-deoxy-D-xylulose-5-phosphate synthase n=1 Tax=Nocardiopsis mangrovi TaxID=1179818 RepID=A0ABV9DX35_9ACTN